MTLALGASAPYRYARMNGAPYFGTMLNFARDPLAFMTVVRDAGDFVDSHGMGMQIVNLCHPDLIEEVLVRHARHFTKDRTLTTLAQPVFGNGLLTSEGDFWLRQRRLSQPAFHRQHIAGYAGMIAERTRAVTARWAPGSVVDLHHAFMGMTLDIVLATLFITPSDDLREGTAQALEAIMTRLNNQGVGTLVEGVLGRLVKFPAQRRFEAAVADFNTLVAGVIAARRASDAVHDDLLGMLMAARDEDGSAMSDAQLLDECKTMFLAGHETTALALSWTFWLLATAPDARAQLRDEARAVLGGRAPAMDDVPRLPFTEQVINESMRLYPPAWALGRHAIDDVEIGGRTIRKGTEVFFSQWAMHRDPRWFDAPLAFKPERWTPAFKAQLPKYAYFPFGGGPRMCIGYQFAMMEAVMMLADLMQTWQIDVLPGQRITPQPSITLRPKEGLKARVALAA